MKEEYYIYLTTNLVNGKQYIGKHKGLLNDDYIGSGIAISAAIDKYGKQNFTKQILCICQTEKECNEKEKFFIETYNAVKDKNFYNIANGGQGGYVTAGYTQEQRKLVNKKISVSNSSENHHMYGKHHTEETKEKLREASLRYWTEDKKKERSEQYKGKNNPMYGKHHTQEAIDKINKDRKIKVYQLNKQTLELVAEYESIRDAERALNASHGLIGRVIDKVNKTAYGFKWKTKL